MNRLKIVADSAIPFLEGALDPWADVVRLPAAAITAAEVAEADALVVRTRTRCDGTLLSGSRVKLVATATIGFDHIDRTWCAAHGIRVATAAGCNARGVLQWFAAAVAWLARQEGWHPRERCVGVIGVGHVGSLVREYAEAWGFRVLCCDPPREERERCGFLPLEEVAAEADLLTLHTPLDPTTRHMVSPALLGRMKPRAVVLNAARGGVADTAALVADRRRCILDVWEGEPEIDRTLLSRALLATPHVAGYSEQGKAQATARAVRAVADHFALPLAEWYPPGAAPSRPRPIAWEELCRSIGTAYDIEAESCALKAHPGRFEAMRNGYRYRREYF